MTTVAGVGRGLLVAAMLVALVASGEAQGPFRITYNVDRSAAGRTKITGQVFNDGGTDVVDVSVTAEALDGGGKVVARGISFVSAAIRQNSSAPFEAVVPAPPTATSFRVRVSSYRPGMGFVQTP